MWTCSVTAIIFSTYIPPQRASSSWGFVMYITWNMKGRKIKLHLKKEEDLEARTDTLCTWCCTPHWYLSFVEEINLAWHQLLRICSLHQKISEQEEENPQTDSSEFLTKWGLKSKGIHWRKEKQRVCTREKRTLQLQVPLLPWFLRNRRILKGDGIILQSQNSNYWSPVRQ